MAAEKEELARLHKETREPNMDREILNKRELYRASVSHRTRDLTTGALDEMDWPPTSDGQINWPTSSVDLASGCAALAGESVHRPRILPAAGGPEIEAQIKAAGNARKYMIGTHTPGRGHTPICRPTSIGAGGGFARSPTPGGPARCPSVGTGCHLLRPTARTTLERLRACIHRVSRRGACGHLLRRPVLSTS